MQQLWCDDEDDDDDDDEFKNAMGFDTNVLLPSISLSWHWQFERRVIHTVLPRVETMLHASKEDCFCINFVVLVSQCSLAIITPLVVRKEGKNPRLRKLTYLHF